jgi:hypothetical protein
MKPEQLKEGQLLIASFLGMSPSQEQFDQTHDQYIGFHSSWDWLMPAVDKILREADLHDPYRDELIETFTGEINIISTWHKVVNWIKVNTEVKLTELKLIANFMGEVPDPHDPAWLSEHNYHENWNLLMQVVNKCTQIGFRDSEDDDDPLYIKWDECFDDTGMFVGVHIDEVFDAVVEFIKFYNQNK